MMLFNNDALRICDFFGVNRATAYRWIKVGKPTNTTALRLLDVAAAGFMPCNEKWDKYFIFNGHLITHLAKIDGRVPLFERQTSQSRNYKPWRDRTPKFVKG
jgi:hypothetical protein